MIDKKDARIVYMGTPDFAVESLRRLVDNGYCVVGVVTMPDKPVGRHGSVVQASPVKQYAQSKGIPVLQPDKLKAPEFLDALKSLAPDLQVVVAFRMLPEAVWSLPPCGTFNLHASLLPQYRGAAPINWAIMHGETETGVTTFFLTHEIDTGRIINQQRLPIGEHDHAGTIHDRLMVMGADLVLQTVSQILANPQALPTVAQETCYQQADTLRAAPKIFKDTCRINWQQPLPTLYNFVRGLAPYPAAWTHLVATNQPPQVLKIYTTEKIEKAHTLPVGTLCTDHKTYMDVAVPGGFLRLLLIQLAGKKQMPVKEFLNGSKGLFERVQ